MVKPRPLSLLLSCSSDHSVSIKITITYLMTSASGAIFVLFDSTIFSTIVITFTTKITRMTAGTEWRVS